MLIKGKAKINGPRGPCSPRTPSKADRCSLLAWEDPLLAWRALYQP